MNETSYFLHLAKPEGTKIWEQADSYLYRNYKYVLNDDGTRRYDDNRFCVVDGIVDVSSLQTVSKRDLEFVARLLGLNIPSHATGFMGQPTTMLKIVKGNSVSYYKDGYRFTGREKVAA